MEKLGFRRIPGKFACRTTGIVATATPRARPALFPFRAIFPGRSAAAESAAAAPRDGIHPTPEVQNLYVRGPILDQIGRGFPSFLRPNGVPLPLRPYASRGFINAASDPVATTTKRYAPPEVGTFSKGRNRRREERNLVGGRDAAEDAVPTRETMEAANDIAMPERVLERALAHVCVLDDSNSATERSWSARSSLCSNGRYINMHPTQVAIESARDRVRRDHARTRIRCECACVVAKEVARKLVEHDDESERTEHDAAPLVEFADRRALVGRPESIADRGVERSVLAEPFVKESTARRPEPAVQNWLKTWGFRPSAGCRTAAQRCRAAAAVRRQSGARRRDRDRRCRTACAGR